MAAKTWRTFFEQRSVTNVIRYVLDSLLPRAIRDNRLFMLPLFIYWFKGKNVRMYMDFKSLVPDMTDREYERVYRDLDCRATARPTDLSTACLEYIYHHLQQVPVRSLLDVGCGRGYLLDSIRERAALRLYGCDIVDNPGTHRWGYVRGRSERLPFADGSIDSVVCCHTLEHVRDVAGAVRELERVAGKHLIVVVPRQRYFYFTLDLHIHFFPERETFTSLFSWRNFTCEDIGGDWVFIAAAGK